MSNVTKLEADLKQLEATAKLPTIANNKTLSESIDKKIAKLKAEIKEAKEGKIAPAKETSKAAPAKPAKKEKAVKRAKPAKTDRNLSVTSRGGFKVGEKVTWVKRATGEKLRGEIVKIYESNNRPGKYIAVVKDKAGKKHEPTIDYLNHV